MHLAADSTESKSDSSILQLAENVKDIPYYNAHVSGTRHAYFVSRGQTLSVEWSGHVRLYPR